MMALPANTRIWIAAGVTEPILDRHFNSKQELFVAIVRSVSERTLQQWHEVISGTKDPA